MATSLVTRMRGVLPGIQLLLTIIVLVLSAFASLQFYSGGTPPQTAYMAFVSSWTIPVTLYLLLAPCFAPSTDKAIPRLVVNCLSTIFWIAGFVVLSVALSTMWTSDGEINFDNNSVYVMNRFYVSSIIAAVLGAIEWVLFVIATIISAIDVHHGVAVGYDRSRAPASYFSGVDAQQVEYPPYNYMYTASDEVRGGSSISTSNRTKKEASLYNDTKGKE